MVYRTLVEFDALTNDLIDWAETIARAKLVARSTGLPLALTRQATVPPFHRFNCYDRTCSLLLPIDPLTLIGTTSGIAFTLKGRAISLAEAIESVEGHPGSDSSYLDLILESSESKIALIPHVLAARILIDQGKKEVDGMIASPSTIEYNGRTFLTPGVGYAGQESIEHHFLFYARLFARATRAHALNPTCRYIFPIEYFRELNELHVDHDHDFRFRTFLESYVE